MRFSGKFKRRFPVCPNGVFQLLKPIIDWRNPGVVVIAGEFRFKASETLSRLFCHLILIF
jgi:hypothetical protein